MGFIDPSSHVMFMVSPGWYNFAIQPPNESPYNWCYSGLVPRSREGGSAHLINHPWFQTAAYCAEGFTTKYNYLQYEVEKINDTVDPTGISETSDSE